MGCSIAVALTGPLKLSDCALEVVGEMSPENIKLSLFVNLVRVCSKNCIYYGQTVAEKMATPITDYDELLAVYDLYANCIASSRAIDYLIGDEICELSESNWVDQLCRYFHNVVMGCADAFVPDITAVQITKFATDGVISLLECGTLPGMRKEYKQAFSEAKEWMTKDYSKNITNTSLLLAEDEWDAQIGKTIANIKSGKSYTKYYGSKNLSYQSDKDLVGQCTWYAYGRFYEVTGIRLEYANDARRWLKDNANDKRVKIVEHIVAQSIAVDKSGKHGHVLFVEYVTYNSDGTPKDVYFTESNWDNNGIYNEGKDCIVQKMSYKQFKQVKSPDGYIVAK